MAGLFHRKPMVWLILIWLMSAITFAQDNLNPEGTGCVDPEGFLDCYDAQPKELTACGQAANKTCTTGNVQTCLAGCSGAHSASKIGCWLQSCWNQVYSCEYQATAAGYLSDVGLVQKTVNIPFYPPPEGDLPGGCSCNIGNVYGNLSDIATYHCMKAAETGRNEVLNECHCCQSDFPISNVLNLCPKSDLSIFGISDHISKRQAVMAASTDGCAVLNANDSAEYCAETYGVVEFTGDKVYNILDLPDGVPGTEPLTNLPGTPFTVFTSVLTLALDPGYTSTITPAAWNAEKATTKAAGGSGTTASGGGGSSAPAPGVPTPTGAEAAATSKTGHGTRLAMLAPMNLVFISASILWSYCLVL